MTAAKETERAFDAHFKTAIARDGGRFSEIAAHQLERTATERIDQRLFFGVHDLNELKKSDFARTKS